MKLKKHDEIIVAGTKKFDVFENIYQEKFVKKTLPLELYPIVKKISSIENEYLAEISIFFNKTQTSIDYLESYYPFDTMQTFILKKIQVSYDHAKNIITQLLMALRDLHSNNIIHRDIKPDNILISTELNLKLTDFNISSFIDDNYILHAGTKGYASPEQYGFNKVNHLSDIFSFGITVKKFLENCCYDLFLELKPVISKCTQVDMANRYESCDVILALINNSSIGFLPLQMHQINQAKEMGLTLEQIEHIAKPFYNSKQMGVLKHCFNENIDINIIQLMSDCKFNSRQMFQIKQGYCEGLQYGDIMSYAKPYYTETDMAIFRNGISQRISYELIHNNIRFYNSLTSTNMYDDHQLRIIRYAFYQGLKLEDIQVISYPHLSHELMRDILDILILNTKKECE